MLQPRLAKTLAIACVACLLPGAGAALRAQGGSDRYEQPDFDKAVFNMDRVLLDREERGKIASALAAVASNFSAAEGIDKQLREMALAIALRVDPVNREAWNANARLCDGRKPEPVARFPGSEQVVAALRDMANRLNDVDADAEKDERVLRAYLLDIARRMRPEDEALKSAFQVAVASRSFPGWQGIVQNYHEEEFLFPPENLTGTQEDKPTGDLPEGTDLKGAEATIRLPLLAAKRGRGLPAAELVALSAQANTPIREPGQPVRLLFASSGGTIHPLKRREKALIAAMRNLHAEWPNNGRKVIVRFEEPYHRLNARAGELPLALALDALFTGEPVAAGVVALGVVDSDGSVLPVGNLMMRLQFRPPEDVDRLLVPAENADDFLDHIVTGKVEPLLKVPVFKVANLAEATQLARETLPAAIQKAVFDFDEVRGVVLSDTLGTGAADNIRTEAVRGWLSKILEAAPNHLSAALLMRYSTGDVPERLTLRGSARELADILGPYRGAISADGAIADLGDAERERARANTRLTGVRDKLDPEIVALADRIADFTKDYESYSGMNSKDSRKGTELKEQLVTSWQGIRARLGEVLHPGGRAATTQISPGTETGSGENDS